MRNVIAMAFILLVGSGCHSVEQTHPAETEKPDYIPPAYAVVDHQGVITNRETFYSFLESVRRGQKHKIKVVTYTKEGDPLLHDVVFDGEKIQSIYDTTRDEYGQGTIESTTCERLAEKELGQEMEYFIEGCDTTGGVITILIMEK
ncbi:DUF4362 domain-containing protein [Mesobacillus jeotgali]|uniref:DUF4362 domain-containing protein n=1 Tax=Mesobacillus jeotgali TaxID=129985 RepID=UPI0009A61417|nr:DUF4362 domain-containing protein [Mesobacillus jeotgali]